MTYLPDYKICDAVATECEPPICAQEHLEYQLQSGHETALIRRVQLGDSTAFDSLVRPHRRRLESTVFKIVRNSHDVEDIVQQCLLQIFAKLNQFRGHSQFSTWITRIAINQSLMYLRKARRPLISIDPPLGDDDQPFSMELPDSGLTPEEAYISIESAKLIGKLIDGLPESRKSVFEKLYLEHLSMDQTARTLGITLAAAKSRAIRARRDIRKAFAGRLVPKDVSRSVIFMVMKDHESKAT
jgi:RNA polymerase sigma-70 factor (ECF subfamily)